MEVSGGTFEIYIFIYLGVPGLTYGTQTLAVDVGSSSLTRTKPKSPALDEQSLSHWPTREVPQVGPFDSNCFGHTPGLAGFQFPDCGIEPRPLQ